MTDERAYGDAVTGERLTNLLVVSPQQSRGEETGLLATRDNGETTYRVRARDGRGATINRTGAVEEFLLSRARALQAKTFPRHAA